MTLQDNTDEALATITQALEDAMQAAGDLLLEKSNELIPVKDGDLIGSGRVDVDGKRAQVSYNTQYAIRQHEKLAYKHPRGGSAKFLERAFRANQSQIEQAIADRLRDAL